MSVDVEVTVVVSGMYVGVEAKGLLPASEFRSDPMLAMTNVVVVVLCIATAMSIAPQVVQTSTGHGSLAEVVNALFAMGLCPSATVLVCRTPLVKYAVEFRQARRTNVNILLGGPTTSLRTCMWNFVS